MKKTLIIFILLFSCIILFVISNQKENEVIISNINNNIEGLVFYLQSEEESEEYISVDTIPSKDEGYVFSKAVCNDNSEVLFNNYTWSLEVSNMENGKIRCKLYFDIDDAIARRYILSQNTVNEEIPNFNTIATTMKVYLYLKMILEQHIIGEEMLMIITFILLDIIGGS